MGALPQALEIIFQMQRKMSNEKITMRKRKLFNLQNIMFFFSLNVSYSQASLFSYFFIHFK